MEIVINIKTEKQKNPLCVVSFMPKMMICVLYNIFRFFSLLMMVFFLMTFTIEATENLEGEKEEIIKKIAGERTDANADKIEMEGEVEKEKSVALPVMTTPKLTNGPMSGIQFTASSLTTTLIQDSLTRALLYLRAVARKDDTALFVPPIRQNSVSDYKEVKLTYKRIPYKYPIYEHETYKVMVRNSAGELKEVTKKRIKKIVGYKTSTRLVQDKNGTISKMIRMPIYTRNGPDIIRPGLLGQNAMAIYASLKCGLSLDDEQLLKAVSTLVGYLDNDIPDRTWDLAWLTIAFVNLPKDNRTFTVMNDGDQETSKWKLKDLTEALVNKLLTGQIQKDKKSKGLWGPVCINSELLSKMLLYEPQIIKKKLSRIKAKLKAKPENAKLQAKLEKAKEEIDDFMQQYLWISQTIKQSNIQSHFIYGEEEGRKRGIRVSGFPCYYVGEQLADIESTALVLYALRQAQLAGYLPEKTIVPKDIRGKDFVKPRKTTAILKQTADILLKLQLGEKAGSEINLWLPEHRFDSIGFANLPFDDKSFTSLESPINDLSKAYTHMALRSLYDLLGPKDAGRRFDKSLRIATNTLPQGIDKIINKQIKNERHIGWMNIYRLIFATIPYCQEKQAQGTRLTEYLLENQTYKNASWLKPQILYMASSSFFQYCKNTAKRRFDNHIMYRLHIKNRNFDAVNKKLFTWAHYMRNTRQHNADITATSTSMIKLIESLRLPALGIWAWNNKTPKTTVLNAAVKALRNKSGVAFNTIQLSAKLPNDKLNSLPLLFLSGTKNFKPEESTLKQLKDYFNAGGLVMVEAPGTSNGFNFIKKVKNMFTKLLPKATPHTFPKHGKMPALSTLLNGDGYIAVIFIPLQNRKASKKKKSYLFSKRQSLKFYKNLLYKRLGPEYLSNMYAINWESFREKEEAAIIAEARKIEEDVAKKEAELAEKQEKQ